uniref:SNARE-complex protein Syntaxin-18 N-terminal domain-containing protein n=1 Tax=Nelumbo nucifera TaxID=4432 RepID=A0A822XZH6_NELNU|nr:TPA_asm: hypothetical protein HUJ06_025923 [Nelumbo nucifera]
MARSRDRTEDFKDTVRSIALSLGYNESKTAAILASFIMHKPRQRSTFTKAALRTLESIKTLEQFILKHRKDYVDPHRTTEQERDSIEHEVSVFIKTCKEQIDILKNRIHDEDTSGKSKAWLTMRSDNSHVDIVAHKHGVVLILSEKLHSITSQFDQLRAIRFQDAVNKAMPRRKMHQVTNSNSPNLLDTVQETETKMVEMSALNHLMATHVLQQTQQIELLYEQAVEATKNVEMGNKEISQAVQRNSSSRTFLLLFLFVLTFSILFLDWYN